MGNLSPGAERATLAHILIEFWCKATKDGRFANLLSDMEQVGSTDFAGVELDDHALPDLGYLPGRTNSEKSIRCWKFCSKLYIVVNTRGYAYGYLLGRDHVVNLIDRLNSIANVRTFMKIYRTTGINDDRPLDISRAVSKVEKYIGERIREMYLEEDTKLPKAMKQVLAILENDNHLHEIPNGMDTGEDRRRSKLLEEVCKDANGLVSLFKELGTYDGIVLDLCYLFHYLPTPDRDIITTLKATREKIYWAFVRFMISWSQLQRSARSLAMNVMRARRQKSDWQSNLQSSTGQVIPQNPYGGLPGSNRTFPMYTQQIKHLFKQRM